MDVVGSEIGQKMRSAIKAKLTELGCYVDDELPDYVMVMVANKRTQTQMEDDLQLFLGDNTELFVNWLHQVLKKLQEVTVVPLKNDKEGKKERSISKERKTKDKKDKQKSKKSDTIRKSKKKDKEKLHFNKEEKKSHKSKKEKKSKSHERIRPNVPPLLMNLEKESEPSITDVFAGQILKNHGVSLDSFKDDIKAVDTKPILEKRPIVPIIDPTTILSDLPVINTSLKNSDLNENDAPRESQLKEINEIEAKIQGLKQKLVEQLDSMSDDEDFLNIRTEAEELMNDFAEDVFQEVNQPRTKSISMGQKNLESEGPPKETLKAPENLPTIAPQPIEKSPQTPTENLKETPRKPIEVLPQIELNLPKRPIRERLGARDLKRPDVMETNKQKSSPESFTPEREIEKPLKVIENRPRSQAEKTPSLTNESLERNDVTTKKLTSKVSTLDRVERTCASVVRVRPRPRACATASNLLLRAVADAHKSLLNIPPKVQPEPTKVKRALVLPMRRCVDPKKIVIQVAADTQSTHDETDLDRVETNKISQRFVSNTRQKEEYLPLPITKKITNTDYVPSRTASRKDDSLIIETINIHNPTVDKDKDTQFIVTMDGYHPNAFLAKKLMTEGILDDDDEVTNLEAKAKTKQIKEVCVKNNTETSQKEEDIEMNPVDESVKEIILEVKESNKSSETLDKKHEAKNNHKDTKTESPPCSTISQKKRLSNTSEDSDTQVIIKREEEKAEKRKSDVVTNKKEINIPAPKRRKASPIVFDVEKKERERERTLSASSDSHVTLSTVTNSNKYDAVPPLSQASTQDRKTVWCRSFPLCRYGSSCVFSHPRCKFATSCTRRGCVYSHPTPPVVASQIVPAANYKSIATIPSMCKFYPNCVNPGCHYYHPKPCRFGKACANKLECNFYHTEVPTKKFSL
ncbi:unnamed protein product [Leptosia nina]|uniref:Zinc finger CCCH domain-containing protein 14 n=1 Tax=Leptosia nina TaxID=320188 RepID=A0AAV1J1A4_9NEOP